MKKIIKALNRIAEAIENDVKTKNELLDKTEQLTKMIEELKNNPFDVK
jgi:hypothetical protein